MTALCGTMWLAQYCLSSEQEWNKQYHDLVWKSTEAATIPKSKSAGVFFLNLSVEPISSYPIAGVISEWFNTGLILSLNSREVFDWQIVNSKYYSVALFQSQYNQPLIGKEISFLHRQRSCFINSPFAAKRSLTNECLFTGAWPDGISG